MNASTFTIPTLETDRLWLRAHKESDIEPEAEFFTTDRSKFIGGPAPREQVWRSIAGIIGHWALRGYGFWAIEDKATGSYLGRAGPWCPDGWPEPEIGWTLMNGAEGHGYAYEAAFAARAYVYQNLGWKTAISMILHGNDRSIRLAEKLGATLEGDFQHTRYGACHIYRHPAPEALL